MNKRSRKELNRIHRNPLPVELSVDTRGHLPLVNVTNGLSWLWLWIRVACICLRSPPREPRMKIVFEQPGVFAVRQESDMKRAWNNGFFGKGTLSRSEPTFKTRVLGETTGSSEAVTSERRRQRRIFKELRAQHQRYEVEERKRELSSEEKQQWEEIKKKMAEASEVAFTKAAKGDMKEAAEEQDVNLHTLVDLEFLQLEAVEAFFLTFALEAAEVSVGEEVLKELATLKLAADAFCGSTITSSEYLPNLDRLGEFLRNYVVYHHYRSLGWCVRNGIKFGCSYLLYKRGPPFHHAEFGVLVLKTEHNKSWEDTLAVARVIGGVRKTLIFVYVEEPSEEQLQEVWESRDSPRRIVLRLLQLYKVCEVVYKRWSPSRTRE
ncbi:tRNA splicing endonuclease subunit sen2 [Candidozyma auris]|uniref:tRNA-splicing endonuclease subunit Sen2 n=2 Tax=Candidozyma auris TaxID=498019 RepID=A0AB36WDG0_CANAR|nr:tRNA-intron endonuclease [[Candida] auris]PIS58492.1 tRNA-intron endonuclease [[Candida] auris]QWW23726.1 hypothetical protein CA7LBN_002527 [[Candida] auris]